MKLGGKRIARAEFNKMGPLSSFFFHLLASSSLFLVPLSLTTSSLVLLLIRLVMGFNFLIGRGYRHLFSERNETIQRWKMNRSTPAWAVILAGTLNFFGAIFLIVGLLVPLVAFFFIIEMAITAYLQRKQMKVEYFGHLKAGYEINVLYILISIILIAFGAGAYSLDALIGL